jgi:hypothetical protein
MCFPRGSAVWWSSRRAALLGVRRSLEPGRLERDVGRGDGRAKAQKSPRRPTSVRVAPPSSRRPGRLDAHQADHYVYVTCAGQQSASPLGPQRPNWKASKLALNLVGRGGSSARDKPWEGDERDSGLVKLSPGRMEGNDDLLPGVAAGGGGEQDGCPSGRISAKREGKALTCQPEDHPLHLRRQELGQLLDRSSGRAEQRRSAELVPHGRYQSGQIHGQEL